jgi:hypothetical protein
MCVAAGGCNDFAGTDGKKFWMISPFLPALKKWIKKNKGNGPHYKEAMAADKAAPSRSKITAAKYANWQGPAAWLSFRFKATPIVAHLPGRPAVRSKG